MLNVPLLAAQTTLAVVTTFAIAAPAGAWQLTWLGHAGFVVQAKDGTTVLVDPWLENPKYPKGYVLPAKIDAILVSHGHFDHASSATGLSAKYKAPVVGVFELASALEPKDGPKALGGNIGGTIAVKGVKVMLVPAVHSSSLGQGPAQYTGTPAGFVLTAAGESPLLHAGDTGVTRDFETVAELYHPKIALLPIGGWFTMGPREAALAARYLKVSDVIPMHYGTFPLLAGTPAELRKAAPGLNVHDMVPGKPVKL